MIRTLSRLFADHPREVEETYVEHFATAGRFALRLARLSGTAFLHAVVPGVHKTTVSDEIKRMADDLGYRAQVARECRMQENGAFDPGL
ncbi:hypothetical protein BH10PSE1_BH10PSE1_05780 [soil metagenome]